MMDLHARRVSEVGADHLLILQHHPVVTKGRRLHGKPLPRELALTARGIIIRDADRGGLLTYHGPGQIVMYFVIQLGDYFDGVSGLVTCIEEELIRFLSAYRLDGRRDSVHPGVWVGEKKVASIGLRVAGGVTCHGLALNVMNDLGAYALFDPCGLSGDSISNLACLLGRDIADDEFARMEHGLARAFQQRLSAEHATRSARAA